MYTIACLLKMFSVVVFGLGYILVDGTNFIFGNLQTFLFTRQMHFPLQDFDAVDLNNFFLNLLLVLIIANEFLS
jgi:hypothetical protein